MAAARQGCSVGRHSICRFVATNANVAGGEDELDPEVGFMDESFDSPNQGLVSLVFVSRGESHECNLGVQDDHQGLPCAEETPIGPDGQTDCVEFSGVVGGMAECCHPSRERLEANHPCACWSRVGPGGTIGEHNESMGGSVPGEREQLGI